MLCRTLASTCRPTTRNGRRVRGLNAFESQDVQLLRAINRAEFSIHGFRNKDLKQILFGTPARPSNTKTGRAQSLKVTRLLALLRAHHLIQKVPRTHRYPITEKGKLKTTAILAAQNVSIKELVRLAV